MTLLDLIRIMLRNIRILILLPLVVGVLVYALTIGQKREYQSSATVNTGLASGFDIASEGTKTDFLQVNNAFDNLLTTINSRETFEETSLKLLAHNLMQKHPNKAEISEESFNELQELFPDELRKKLVAHTEEETFYRLLQYKKASYHNELVDLLDGSSSTYSIQKIKDNLKTARKGTSDMLELTYTANDPALCRNLLGYLIEVFTIRYSQGKNSEASDVVKYYVERVDSAFQALERAENIVKEFKTANKLINYGEQTKYLAESQQETETAREVARQKIEETKEEKADLEKQIAVNQQIYQLNQQLADMRKEMSSLQYRVTNAEVMGVTDDKIESQKRRIKELEKLISAKVDETHKYENDVSGMPRESILKEWQTNNLDNVGANSELQVIDKRMADIGNTYKHFAPLGAKLSQLERQVEIAEKEYLNCLNNLNFAKLRKQSASLNTGLAVLDEAYFPLKPLPSKRALILLFSMMGTFFVLFGSFVTMKLLDDSIATIENAQKLTHCDVVGAIPDFDKLMPKDDGNHLRDSIFSKISGAISLKYIQMGSQDKRPKNLFISSLHRNEGKAWFMMNYADYLAVKGYQVALVVPDEDNFNSAVFFTQHSKKIDLFVYTIDKDFIYRKSVKELAGDHIDEAKYDFVITYLPGITDNQLPVDLIGSHDLLIHLLDSNRIWSEADTASNDLVCTISAVKPVLIVNKVSIDNLEKLYGEFPKKRSKLRTLIKHKLS